MHALLVHGMGRTPLSMVILAARLRRAGMAPRLFGYLPALESFERIVGRLVRRLETLAVHGEYLVVGHSLGGLLLRAALARVDAGLPGPRHLFMLATPNQSPRLARRFHRNPIYRFYTGDAGQLLADPARVAAIPQPAVPYTIIAGTGGTRRRWNTFRDEPNDWIVGLSEVRLTDGEELVTVPIGHTFLMNVRTVATEIIERTRGRSLEPAERRRVP